MLGCAVNGLAEIKFSHRFEGPSPLEQVIQHLQQVRQNVGPLISLLGSSGGLGGGTGGAGGGGLNVGSLLMLGNKKSDSSGGGGLDLGSLLLLASKPKPASSDAAVAMPTEISSNPAASLGLAGLF